MKFSETPNYSYIISLMESLVLDEADEVDMIFDWMMPEFYGVKSEGASSSPIIKANFSDSSSASQES